MKKSLKNQNDTPDYYYWENGLLVFTREYHLKRGYCCKSGCRHCPFGFRREGDERNKKGKLP